MFGNGDIKATADSINAVSTFWNQCIEQSDRQARMMMEVMQAASDPQQLQRRWLDAVSQSLEDFMRSPAFLELMKQQLKAVTDLKGLQNQVLQGTVRQLGIPLADDITGLFERLNSTERTILNRLRAIEDRLKAVEAKLGSTPEQPSQS